MWLLCENFCVKQFVCSMSQYPETWKDNQYTLETMHTLTNTVTFYETTNGMKYYSETKFNSTAAHLAN